MLYVVKIKDFFGDGMKNMAKCLLIKLWEQGKNGKNIKLSQCCYKWLTKKPAKKARKCSIKYTSKSNDSYSEIKWCYNKGEVLYQIL